jgi:hypothetical protein
VFEISVKIQINILCVNCRKMFSRLRLPLTLNSIRKPTHEIITSGTERITGNQRRYITRAPIGLEATPTWKNQSQIPRLPIPRLEDTCKKYLEQIKPLLNEKEFQFTSAAVQEFLKIGTKLKRIF